ncbi:MAG: hypothetical protein QXY39_03445 [Thermofilaceae archaeon]
MARTEEVDGVRYVVVRITGVDLERINDLAELYIEIVEELPFFPASYAEELVEAINEYFDSYMLKLVSDRYGIDEERICFDYGPPDICEAYVITDGMRRIGFKPEVWIREDKYKG